MAKNLLIKDNAKTTLTLLLKRLGCSYDNSLYDLMEAHPDFPSFLSFHYILKRIGIDNVAIKATFEDLRLKVPKPAIVHVVTNTDLFLIVDEVDDNNIYVINANNKREVIEKSLFLKMWKSEALIVDKDNIKELKIPTETKIKSFLSSARKPFIIIGAIALLSFLFFHNSSRDIYNMVFILLFAIGAVFSTLLLVESFDKYNVFIKKICSSKSGDTKVNCSNILDSKDAYFLGLFSWSDIGFVYMISFFLICLVIPVEYSNSIACFCSILSFGYVFYSIYHQKYIAKNWCRLCLAVQTVLTGLFILSIIVLSQNKIDSLLYSLNPNSIIGTLVVGVAVVVTYVFLKPYIQRGILYKYINKQYGTLKHYPIVQDAIIESEPIISLEEIYKMKMGNMDANTTISIVFSPICNPCLVELKELLSFFSYKEDTKLELIFFLDKEKHPNSYILAQNLLATYIKSPDSFINILKDYVYRYPLSANRIKEAPSDNEHLVKIIEDQDKWCKKNKFSGTPVVMFNGHRLNPIYTMKDVDYMCF